MPLFRSARCHFRAQAAVLRVAPASSVASHAAVVDTRILRRVFRSRTPHACGLPLAFAPATGRFRHLYPVRSERAGQSLRARARPCATWERRPR